MKPKHVALLEESISHAEKLLPEYPGLKLEELAVEIAVRHSDADQKQLY